MEFADEQVAFTGHEVHAWLPEDNLYVPAAQAVQAFALAVKPGLHLNCELAAAQTAFAGQAKQSLTEFPEFDLYLPEAQEAQALLVAFIK